jgi:hypothetical protein
MAGRTNIRAELEEQRCLIEGQQVEIQRQRHRIEMQRLHLAYLEAELDAIRVTSRPASPTIESTHRPPSNGGHRAARCVRDEAIFLTDHM